MWKEIQYALLKRTTKLPKVKSTTSCYSWLRKAFEVKLKNKKGDKVGADVSSFDADLDSTRDPAECKTSTTATEIAPPVADFTSKFANDSSNYNEIASEQEEDSTDTSFVFYSTGDPAECNTSTAVTEIALPVVDSTSKFANDSSDDKEIASELEQEEEWTGDESFDTDCYSTCDSAEDNTTTAATEIALPVEDSTSKFANYSSKEISCLNFDVAFPSLILLPYFDYGPFPEGFIEAEFDSDFVFCDHEVVCGMRREGFVVHTGILTNIDGDEHIGVLLGIESVKEKYNSLYEFGEIELSEDELNCVNSDFGACQIAVRMLDNFFVTKSM